ncbi:hypothetical protein [Amniculibacterium aquaticum]|uniref:hypothetical protein n=1 Tax=Amniculibacterium aquaticum TaxID=2479858 RepID=UPI000F5B1DB3|nr:hypothetical protein [Amniculibacterium aquaticum]
MIKSVINNASINAQNILGKKINQKVLVIESDDWGSIRMSSSQAYTNLLNNGISVDKCPYNRFDNLETNNDLEAIYDLLFSLRDKNNNPLKITANTIVANPDFEKIKSSNYQKYFYEDFTATYKRLNNQDTFNTFLQGKNNNLFIPQLHGREHLQVNLWLDKLKEGDKETLFAFDNEVYGHPTKLFSTNKQSFLSAYHYRNMNDEHQMLQSIDEATLMFEKFFGFKSESFIAPRYIWNDNIEERLSENNVKYIQGVIVQNIPKDDFYRKKINLFGKQNRLNQTYITRNVFFEPSLNPKFNWVADALKRINVAFKWNKPAVISMHRLNFMGSLNEDNRKNNLMLLKNLITEVKRLHPDVVFKSTNELGILINMVDL